MGQILKQRDIVLVPFPYPDQTGIKRRPALVLSSDEFNRTSQDAILCGITSFNNGDPQLVAVKKEDWEGGMWSESYANPAYITSLYQGLVIKPIGRLGSKRFAEVREKLGKILG